jgi:hypothetical protein
MENEDLRKLTDITLLTRQDFDLVEREWWESVQQRRVTKTSLLTWFRPRCYTTPIVKYLTVSILVTRISMADKESQSVLYILHISHVLQFQHFQYSQNLTIFLPRDHSRTIHYILDCFRYSSREHQSQTTQTHRLSCHEKLSFLAV